MKLAPSTARAELIAQHDSLRLMMDRCEELADALDAARLYDRRWATTLLERAVGCLAQEYGTRQRSHQFEELRRFLVGEQTETSYVEAAQRLGMTINALRMAVSRMRGRYRELLRDEIRQTVNNDADFQEEYRSLMEALRH